MSSYEVFNVSVCGSLVSQFLLTYIFDKSNEISFNDIVCSSVFIGIAMTNIRWFVKSNFGYQTYV